MQKIVCLGDSLTYGYQVGRSQCWTTLLNNRMKAKAEVLNRGICGDTSGGLLGRFQSDVCSLKPTHVVIMAGVNDFIWQTPLGLVKANIAALVFQSLHYGIAPFLGVPIPVAEDLAQEHWNIVTDWKQVNEDIRLLRQWIFEFSAAFGCQYIDFYQLFIDTDGHPLTKFYIDGLHPTATGNQMMADYVRL